MSRYVINGEVYDISDECVYDGPGDRFYILCALDRLLKKEGDDIDELKRKYAEKVQLKLEGMRAKEGEVVGDIDEATKLVLKEEGYDA